MRRWAGVFLVLTSGCSSSSASDGGADAAPTDASIGDVANDAAPDALVFPKARAAVSAAWGDGGIGCMAGSILTIGALPNGLVEDGADAGPAKAAVTCAVQASGQMYNTTLHAELLGKMMSVDLNGKLTTTGAQTIDVVMLRGGMGPPANKMMCTATISPMGAVAAGKAWLQISCPGMMNLPPPDGCSLSLEARFENCLQ